MAMFDVTSEALRYVDSDDDLVPVPIVSHQAQHENERVDDEHDAIEVNRSMVIMKKTLLLKM